MDLRRRAAQHPPAADQARLAHPRPAVRKSCHACLPPPAPSAPPPGPTPRAPEPPVPIPDFGRVPPSFIPNAGHVAAEAVFYARASRYTLWMTEGGLIFDASRPGAAEGPRSGGTRGRGDSARREREVTALAFPGADPRPTGRKKPAARSASAGFGDAGSISRRAPSPPG